MYETDGGTVKSRGAPVPDRNRYRDDGRETVIVGDFLLWSRSLVVVGPVPLAYEMRLFIHRTFGGWTCGTRL